MLNTLITMQDLWFIATLILASGSTLLLIFVKLKGDEAQEAQDAAEHFEAETNRLKGIIDEQRGLIMKARASAASRSLTIEKLEARLAIAKDELADLRKANSQLVKPRKRDAKGRYAKA